jgi:hypothetical protein
MLTITRLAGEGPPYFDFEAFLARMVSADVALYQSRFLE